MSEQIKDGTGIVVGDSALMRVENNRAWVNNVDISGNSIGDPLSRFKSSDRDQSSPNIRYFGLNDTVGSWYILRSSGISPILEEDRYVSGSTDYLTNWSNRASLTYDYFYNVF